MFGAKLVSQLGLIFCRLLGNDPVFCRERRIMVGGKATGREQIEVASASDTVLAGDIRFYKEENGVRLALRQRAIVSWSSHGDALRVSRNPLSQQSGTRSTQPV